MPTVLTNALRQRWTSEQCAPLEASGLFGNEHLELVDGEPIRKMGKRRPHANAVATIYPQLQKIFGERFVNIGAPIDVSPGDNPTNETEPDSTLTFDPKTKASLHARAGIIEYWVLDVERRRLIARRAPVVYSEHEPIAPLAAPAAEFRLSQAFAD